MMLLFKRQSHTPIVYLYVVSTIYIVFLPFLKRFNLIDEGVVFLMALYSLNYFNIYKKKEVFITFLLLFFWLLYSLYLQVNVSKAAIFDFIVFLKPFICFYVAYYLSIHISKYQKKCFKWLYLIFGLYCLLILPYISVIYSNTAGYYPACILCAVSYLYFSEKRKKDWIIALCLLTPGLFSIRAKFFTEYVIFLFIAFFLKKKVKINLKYTVIFSILVLITIYINWYKFKLYFFVDDETELARSLFYIHSWDNIKDFFPFGPGFGTYGTEAAAKYYSPLYYKYKMYYIWGLSQESYGGTGFDFLKDTFYPVLSQFGIVGIGLFFSFWYRLWNLSKRLPLADYKLFLFLFLVEAIQNIADNSFTGHLGVPLMMLLGVLLGEAKCDRKRMIQT